MRGSDISPPIPSNRVSVWVSGGSNYVYETNKSEREAETEATQDTPFSLVKKSFTGERVIYLCIVFWEGSVGAP